jgi:hypothetical protein
MTARRLIALLGALILLPLLAVTTTTSSASAVGNGPLFTPLKAFRPGSGDRVRVRPTEFRAYRADVAGIRAALAGGGTRSLDLPAPTGEVATFRVVEDSVMEPELQAAHPEIRTYSGRGPDGSSIRLDITPMGFHAFVRNPDGRAWYVDPVQDRVGEDRVLSYLGAEVPRSEQSFVERELERHGHAAPADGVAPAPGGIVSTRTYRLAFLTDKSYADRFGTANVFAEKTTMVNRVNEVYNDDLAIRFVLVADTDTLLNFDIDAKQTGANGPCGANACYTTDQLAGCDGPTLDRNEFVLGQVIGADNYDVGHLGLGKNGGGIAGLGVVGGPFKADGCTGLPNPTGDFYAIDYVAHEVGHQMGGDHTFNGTQVNCSAGNRNTTPFATQVEPGSGSSIMAYAGICQQDNLQPHSDPYFSFSSVDEVNATTAAAATNENEQQVVNLQNFDGTDSFTLSCGGCPVSGPIANGSSYNSVNLAAAVLAVTGQVGTISGYDGGLAPDAAGFTVDWLASTADFPTLTVTPVSGTFTTFTGTTYNGGPTDNQGLVAATTNSSPVITAPADRSIPARTPFTLTGAATDPNAGDTLTYLWEQTDPGGATGTGLVDNNKTNGPLFRQFGLAADVSSTNTLLYHSPGENLAGTSPSRTFPDLAQVLSGNTNAATGTCPAAPAPPASGGATNVPAATIDCYSEFLPTAAWLGNPLAPRVLHFRLTARDEFTADAAADHAGGLSSDDVALTVDPAAGPFLVTSRPAGGLASGLERVTWSVARTNTAALAQKVRISLSTDGGLTYPTVLAASTPNDGSEVVTLPSITTATARLKVEAVGNYFFDVNDANFSITSARHLANGRGTFTSPKGSSRKARDATGKATFEFAGETDASPSGRASFRFKKGRIAFTGDAVEASVIKGNTITMKVRGTHRGKKYTLLIVALDKGSRDRIRIRLVKGKKLVYDSMPGKKLSAKPRTKVKGHITVR